MALTLAARLIAAGFSFVAFILFLVCSLSAGISPRVYFANYVFSGQRVLRLGIWGSCTFDVVPANGALINQSCIRATGWNIPLAQFPGRINDLYPAIGGNLSSALTVYPLAAGFSLLGTIAALIAEIAVLLDGLAAALGFAGVVIHFLLFQRIDQQLRQSFVTNSVVGGLRQCIWIGIAGLICIAAAAAAAFTGTAHRTRQHGSLKKHEKASERYW